MNYPELKNAVFAAYRQRDWTECFSLVDSFIETAQAEALGTALCLKAELMVHKDIKRTIEAFNLVRNGLYLLRDNPAEKSRALVSAMMCALYMGDVEALREYEAQALQLLQAHGDDPGVHVSQFRMYMNLGFVTKFRGEYVLSYWHYTKAINHLLTHGSDGTTTDRDCWLFWCYCHSATACLHIGRIHEAQEALEKAEALADSPNSRAHCIVGKAELLLHTRRCHEAVSLLDELGTPAKDAWTPETRAMYFLTRALAAQETGDLRGYHRNISAAQQEAVEYTLDFILSRIQRIQRAPLQEVRWGD